MWPSVSRLLIWIAPHGLVTQRRSRAQARRDSQERLTARARYAAAEVAVSSDARTADDYASLMRRAIDAGVDAEDLRIGSIGLDSLRFVLSRIESGPGLHVGNYAGISLAYLAANTTGLIVAVDPNVPHRGLAHPQDVVARLLASAGVEDRVLLVCGYSGKKNPSNDGWLLQGYDPSVEIQNECAPTDVLGNLRELALQFGWVLLDGNHHAEYLRSELDELAPLVREGGAVFLDDCDEYWPEIRETFMTPGTGWTIDDTDGRIGVLRRTSE